MADPIHLEHKQDNQAAAAALDVQPDNRSRPHYRWKLLDKPNVFFLGSTYAIALIGAPLYLWKFGLDPFQLLLFLFFYVASGMSITLGYHRLFAHRAFDAHWSVRLLTVLFGAAAFERSTLRWAMDHRRHHRHVDDTQDPYDATKGLFYSHMGWVLLRDPKPRSRRGGKDLECDPFVLWQDRHYGLVAVGMGFGLPALIGFFWNGGVGALGGFLLAGVARMVMVQQFTFLINSISHASGTRPYTTECTARDNIWLAFLTFGEGYHNFHHAFQADYRNGIRPWHFDPTKWAIWLLSRIGLASRLHRIPEERIIQRRALIQQRTLAEQLQREPNRLTAAMVEQLKEVQERFNSTLECWQELDARYRAVASENLSLSLDKLEELKEEFAEASQRLRVAFQEWQETHRLAMAQFA